MPDPQERTPKFTRQPERFLHKQITERSLQIIEYLARYRFLQRSLLIRLVAGDERTTDEHLQWMWHRGLIQRFAFPRIGNPSEFNYYLDSSEALRLLKQHRPEFRLTSQHWEDVRNNRMRDYVGAIKRQEQGRLLFLHHELMISRFHALLELACRESGGKVQLVSFIQGSPLYNHVIVPEIRFEPGDRPVFGRWVEGEGTEKLSHRPDALFTLRYPDRPDEAKQLAHFFYEADRKTMKSTDMKTKLRAHFHFAVKYQREYLQKIYGISHIRAVLVETPDEKRLEQLRAVARTAQVSGRPSPLFWFTATEFLHGPDADAEPLYLSRPDIILKGIWITPVNDTLHSLMDP